MTNFKSIVLILSFLTLSTISVCSAYAEDKDGISMRIGAREYDPTTGKDSIETIFRFKEKIIGEVNDDLVTGKVSSRTEKDKENSFPGEFRQIFSASEENNSRCFVTGRVPLSKGFSSRRGRAKEAKRYFTIEGGPESAIYQILRFEINATPLKDSGQVRYALETTQIHSKEKSSVVNFNIECYVDLPHQALPSEGFKKAEEFLFSSVEEIVD